LRVAIPRRIADGVRRIVAILPRLSSGRAARFARTDLIEPALDTLELDLIARDQPTDIVRQMRETELPRATRSSARPPSSHRPPRARAPRGAPR